MGPEVRMAPASFVTPGLTRGPASFRPQQEAGPRVKPGVTG